MRPRRGVAEAPEIPLDIREAMRECILAIFWPKKKIVEFLIGAGCSADLIGVEAEFSRHMLVTDAFSKLAARADRGHPAFQSMIDQLTTWSYFDPYYFEKLDKLDKGEAVAKIAQLRTAIDRRNSAVANRRAASQQSKKQQVQKTDLRALTQAFTKLYGTELTPQARGKLFETFLRELFKCQSIKMGDQLRLVGEEIDGTFKFEGENYIVEAKWQDPSTSTSQLYIFAHKVDGKMHGRGLFISVNGFSHEGIKAIVHGKHIQTILMDGQDLSYVLEDRITLESMLDYKIRAAQTRGDVYVCALLQRSKV